MNRKQILSHTAEQSDKLPVCCLFPQFKKKSCGVFYVFFVSLRQSTSKQRNHLYVELFIVFTMNNFGAPNIPDCLSIDYYSCYFCDGFW